MHQTRKFSKTFIAHEFILNGSYRIEIFNVVYLSNCYCLRPEDQIFVNNLQLMT